MKLSQFIKQLNESNTAVSRSKFVEVMTLLLGRVSMCLIHAEKTLPQPMQRDGGKWVEHIIFTIKDISNKFRAKNGNDEIDEFIKNNYDSIKSFILNIEKGLAYYMPHENDTQFKMAHQWVQKIKKELSI
jgi:hypothetical protein